MSKKNISGVLIFLAKQAAITLHIWELIGIRYQIQGFDYFVSKPIS